MSPESLAYWDSVNGVCPAPLIQNAFCARSPEEADQLLQFYRRQTDVYTNQCRERDHDDTRIPGNPEAPAPAAAPHPNRDNESGYMQGLNDVDIHMSAASTVHFHNARAQVFAEATGVAQNTGEEAVDMLNNPRGTFFSTMQSRRTPFSDYDPRWPLLAYPSMFPNGKGKRNLLLLATVHL